MITGKINPAYIQLAIGSGVTLLVGLGLLTLTDIQQDMILKFVGFVLLLLGITTVPTAGAVQTNVDDAYEKGLYTTPPDQSY